MAAPRPPLALRALLGASLALSVVTAGHALQYTREWAAERAGRSTFEQRATFRRVPWLQAEFMEAVERLERALPPDARVLIEPTTAPDSEREGFPPRFYFYLAHALYPRQVFVRRPDASSAFFNFKEWLDHHFEVLDLDGSGGAAEDAAAIAAEEQRALRERGVGWRLRVPVWPYDPRTFALDRLEGGEWVEQEDFGR
jgi:hypothetical protein